MKVNLYPYFIICLFVIKSIDSQKKSAIDSSGPIFLSWYFPPTTGRFHEESRNPIQKTERNGKGKITVEPIKNVKKWKNVSPLGKIDRKPQNVLQTRKIDTNTINHPRKRKSETMCEKYSKMSKHTIWVQYPTNFEAIPISVLNCDKLINPLIAGGKNALVGEFPHMAILAHQQSSNGKERYACAASLISEKWILTSAHCSYKIPVNTAFVYLGSNRLMDSKMGQIRKVKRIKIHPKYVPPLAYADIALVELEEPIPFGLNLKPACLQVDANEVGNLMKVLVSGWGSSYYGGDLSANLLKAKLDLMANVNCSTLYKSSMNLPRGIDESLMCAGDESGNWKKDTCPGDSGSPLQIRQADNCLYKIIGITSTGKFCGVDTKPGIYTRVAAFIDWIEEIVWPDLGR